MRMTFNQQILLGAVIGVLVGVGLNTAGPEFPLYAPVLYTAQLVGKGVFVNLLKMIMIPLIFSSIVIGIANLRAHEQMSKVWKITLTYFFCSSSLAIILGLIVVNLAKPGVGLSMALFDVAAAPELTTLSLSAYLKEFVAGAFRNPLAAMAAGDVLPTIIFALFLGIGLIVAGDKSAGTVLKFFDEFFKIMMLIVGWIMKLLPLGLLALLLDLFATQNMTLFGNLAKFMAVVTGVTLFHGLVVLPGILYLLTGTTPLRFFLAMRESLITAFSTSSSNATLPVTMQCVENNLKVDKSIAGFVLPLGATANMDGTALYEAMAAMFVANLVGIELSLAQQFTVFITAMVASIGAPGIPSAGLVTMMLVLQSVGLPVEAIAILIPIDRPLDAIRTVVNVEGDAVCSQIVQKFTQKMPS